jgi:2-polyprenyl-3-methyl-5-hydroxy-6-metoxy-1,4-benzoquinol methylase
MQRKKEPLSERTLQRDLPELKEYLRRRARVLDVGCGFGTITLDVAAAVYPGKVTGIDPDERPIRNACIGRRWSAW